MIYFKRIGIFILFALFQGSIQEEKQRDGKVFSLFSIVSFPNAGCASQSNIGSKARNGTCYTSTECSDKGGKVSGNCAAGFGVCCLFITSTSGSTVSQNCSYIQNPNFPSAYGSETAISFTVAKCSADVCTLRLDFETFTTGAAAGTMDVNTELDTFQITTTPVQFTIPAIAGENSGAHVYVEIGKDAGATATLAFTFGTSTTQSRSWEIKVTQLECTNPSRPDSGCLQYFTGSSGRIESFNFAQTATANYQHLSSQQYSICIRKALGYNCIEYTSCSEPNPFGISAHHATDLLSHTGSLCSRDYVEINGASAMCDSNILLNRFCGVWLSASNGIIVAPNPANICDCTAPFTVTFVTDSPGAEIIAGTGAGTEQRGFCLEYNQVL